MKKIFAVFLSLALLLGLVPLSVSATTVITEISVNVVEPTAGTFPRYESTLSHDTYILDDETSDYKKGGITWYKGDNIMSTSESFEAGNTYSVRVELLRANEGYEFSVEPYPSVKINGKDAYVSYANSNYIILDYTFPVLEGYTVTFNANGGTGTMNPIEGIAGKFTIPECTFTPPSGKEFKGWLWENTNEEWYPGETATVNKDISFKAVWKAVSGREKIFDVVATSEDIDTIPVLYGFIKIPSFTVTEGAPAYVNASTGNLRWEKKIGDDWVIQYDARFTPGEWRVLTSVRIDKDADKYELGNPTTLTVNGEKWTPDNGTGKPHVYPNYSMLYFTSPVYVIEDDPNVAPPVSLESVHLRIDGYEAGSAIEDAQVVSDDEVNIDAIMFEEIIDENNDGLPDNTIIAEGNFSTEKQYLIRIIFSAKSGYDVSALFGENVSLENALTEVFAKYSEEEDRFACTYILEPLKVFTIAFLPGEGNGSMSPVMEIKGEYILPECEFTAPEGKQFKAWRVNGVEMAIGDVIDVTADTIITAVWEDVPVHEHSMLKIVTPATTKKAGQIQHFCEFCEEYYTEEIAKIKEIRLSEKSYTYDGKAKTPTLTIVDVNGKKLVEGEDKDYTVTYAEDRINIGKYTVKVSFKNNYSGKASKSFTIIPKGTTIKSVTGAKKAFTVTWKKQTKKTMGYEVQYSLKKNFKKAKTAEVKKNKTTKVTVKKLKAKKTYYVRVRTFGMVNGNKVYSSWSARKSVKTK